MSEAQTLSQKLIPGKEVTKIVGFGRTKLNLLVKEGKFPQPIRFSDNFIRWDLEEVNNWIEQQKAMRGA